MNLLCHKFLPKKNSGIILLEVEPHFKTLIVVNGSGYYHRLYLPYMYFVLEYRKYGDQFIYDGVYKEGLRVYSSIQPIDSFVAGKVGFCPIEKNASGVACTPHQYDGKGFDTLKELVEFVIGTWWGLEHYFYGKYLGDWKSVKNNQQLGSICQDNFENILEIMQFSHGKIDIHGYGSLTPLSSFQLQSEKIARIPWKEVTDL